MSNSAAPAALVCAVAIWEPSGLINATLAPAPKAPRAGTTLILFTVGGGTTGGVTTGGGVTMGVVVLLESPPQPASNAKGKTKHASNLLIFIMMGV
jgi:hypothetical protein